jgi:hypothetical protein
MPYTACVPASTRVQPLGGLVMGGPRTCRPAVRAFFSFYGSGQGFVLKSGLNAQTVPFLLLAVPVLLGAFVGGPVLARELDPARSASRGRRARAGCARRQPGWCRSRSSSPPPRTA